MTPYPWPWVECGEIFYGWMEHDQIQGMDFSVPRRCNLPENHRGTCWYWPIHDAGEYPRREYKWERRMRIRREYQQRRFAS